MVQFNSMYSRFKTIYPVAPEAAVKQLSEIIEQFKQKHPELASKKLAYSEKDAIFIAYADHVHDGSKPTLQAMSAFFDKYLDGVIGRVHFLPFYPYSSDDGFSVIDYYKIKPEFGDWSDVESIAKKYDLMFDLVVNHISQKSEWFQEFLKGNPKYQDYFIAYDEPIETAQVFRPRTHPVLTPFKTAGGTKYVWTTFSDDQIDLNFGNPEVLIEMIKVLLFYIEMGASVVRLDAVGYLWKKEETPCIHLSETHEVIKLIRDILNEVAPHVWIITETNVPHKDNISYFGSGSDEAHLVYNFTLPPLLLHTFIKGDSSDLTKWAGSLTYPSDTSSFFNFTASHDGIGVTPLKGIIPDEDIMNLAEYVKKKGGFVNMRTVAGQQPQPYELNTVYLSALGGNAGAFLASQAIALSLKGVPAIYFNSLTGAENWTEGVEKLGYNRAINRQKFDLTELSADLDNPESKKHAIYKAYSNMIKIRTAEPLFSPTTDQQIVDLGKSIFCVLRSDNSDRLVALVNISDKEVTLDETVRNVIGESKHNLLTDSEVDTLNSLTLSPYQVMWLK